MMSVREEQENHNLTQAVINVFQDFFSCVINMKGYHPLAVSNPLESYDTSWPSFFCLSIR